MAGAVEIVDEHYVQPSNSESESITIFVCECGHPWPDPQSVPNKRCEHPMIYGLCGNNHWHAQLIPTNQL